MRTIAVTGGSGFIGQHLIHNLLRHTNYKVVCLSRSLPSQQTAIFPTDFKSERFVYERADVVDESKLEEIFNSEKYKQDLEFVVHLAAQMDFHPRASEVAKMNNINVNGTENMLQVCSKLNKTRSSSEPKLKFLFVSSQEAIGPSKTNTLLDETSPCNPGFLYGQTKVKAEQLVRKYSYENKMPCAIFRVAGTTGFGESYTAFELIQVFSFGIMVVYPGACQGVNSYVHVDDVCQAIELAIQKSETVFDIYQKSEEKRSTAENEVVYNDKATFIIGPRAALTFKENIDLIASELGLPKPFFHAPLSVFVAVSKVLGWILSYIYKKPSFLFHPETMAAMTEYRNFSSQKAMTTFGYNPMTTKDAFIKTIRDEVAAGRIVPITKRASFWILIAFVFICLFWIVMRN